MPQHPESAIGNLADLDDGQIALSRFIVQREGGLHVQPGRLEAATELADFVDRVIATGLYFRGLDYECFISLLYGHPATRGPASPDEVLLAADITAFRPERRALYKELLIDGDEAAYLFEPLYLESPDGEPATETRVRLDVDEFIASAWAQGVRFGIDVAAVGAGFDVDKAERRIVARSLPYVPGKDAEVCELAPGLHRNNAPRRLLGDRVDLRQFETRYPQVAAGLRLVRKNPRTPGTDGRNLAGQALPPPLSKDFDLASLAGPGTRISHEDDGEYLLTTVCGFLNIDRQSNQFSITDKIISHEGVSVRTTGDLLLTGEEYEQHGEIQEKRVVQCRSITAYADVYGRIISTGGLVRLQKNLVGGSASNDDGDIVVEGMASGASLTALAGCINVKRADNCVLLARQVIVGQATNCNIVADELTIEVAEACALAAQTTRLGSSRARRELDNVLLLLLPDLSAYDTKLSSLRGKRAATDKAIAAHRARMDVLRNDKEVANYLALAQRLRNHEATLSADQQVGWRRLSALVAPTLRSLSQLSELVKELATESEAFGKQIDAVLAAREEACSKLNCDIARIEGETRVSALLPRPADVPLHALPGKELKARLRRTDAATRLLFAGHAGQFSWSYRSRPA
ncbi:MAG TPA: FapA family protein [Candidatus Accumulibacter phosphatis]|nr:FapA family protein [Candidatus Accumulibacter phosphatis]HRQ94526.1 FapA family protein [Candidatus Accumulibacter phosphatis]